MRHALKNHAINLNAWIEQNGAALKPPIGNKQFWKGDWQNLLVMMVGGPNWATIVTMTIPARNCLFSSERRPDLEFD